MVLDLEDFSHLLSLNVGLTFVNKELHMEAIEFS